MEAMEVFDIYAGGFSIENLERDLFKCNIDNFYIKNNKIYLLGDRIRFKYFNKILCPFINKKGKYVFLKGEARINALLLKAKISYKKLISLYSEGVTEVFYDLEKETYIMFRYGKIFVITKSKNKIEDELFKTLNKKFELTHTDNKKIFEFNETIYSKNEPEDFQTKIEELEELLSIVRELQKRKITFEERELLKEISSEIESLI